MVGTKEEKNVHNLQISRGTLFWFLEITMSACELEPGAASESVLVTTNSSDNLERMSSSLEEIKNKSTVETSVDQLEKSNSIDNLEDAKFLNTSNQDDDYIRSKDWLEKKTHVFVLSSAGKPIYSR